jgi:hypothetical protein
MAAADLTREELEHYASLHERRLELNRQAAALEREADLIEPKIWAFIKKQGNRSKAVSKWGFNLAVKLKQAAVKWKDEFLKLAGAEKVAELAAAAPMKESLSVERAA